MALPELLNSKMHTATNGTFSVVSGGNSTDETLSTVNPDSGFFNFFFPPTSQRVQLFFLVLFTPILLSFSFPIVKLRTVE
jgi:hypothetical protein